MSFYDRKALVILSILWNMVNIHTEISKQDKEVLLHRIQLCINEYKTNLKKKEHTWIQLYLSKFNALIFSDKFDLDFSLSFLYSLIYIVSEHYLEFLKNPRRIAVWDSLESFISKQEPLKKIDEKAIETAEKINELIFNDCLFL